MTCSEKYSKILKDLSTIYDEREAANIADWAFENVTGYKKIDRIIYKSSSLDDKQVNQLKTYSEALLQHKPVQYVLNEGWFAGLKLYVDESVLIPRPETEELVEWIVEEHSKVKHQKSKLSIVDVGTGSGCIALALKKKLGFADITAIDISNDALIVARKNSAAHKLHVDFLQVDVLDKRQLESLEDFDIIVSNPPYIRQSEEALMNENVLRYEPHVALFVPDDDALIFYKALGAFAQTHLKIDGRLFVEINEGLAQSVIELFESYDFKHVELRKDLQGKDRMIKATKY